VQSHNLYAAAFCRHLLAGICAALLFANTIQPVYGQVLYGSLIGTITDPSGSVVPNASITLTAKDTGVTRDATSDDGGRYSFVNVLPGKYDVKVTSTGFKTSLKTDIDIVPNSIGREDVALDVGQMTETVSVVGTAAELQTDKADTHSVIESKTITSLPLGNYRNYQSLINLVPGATPAALQNSITDTPGRALQTHINGGNAQTNITRIDGATSVNVWLPHHVGYVTPEENVDVVNITTGSADAEQGMAGTSAITLVTKSGTNEIHGSAFEFHDDQHLKARNFFQAAGTDKPLSIFNNFGGTVGGPILKNKLFYFLSYDGTKQRQASPGFYTVPTGAQQAGDFSAISTILYDPLTGNTDGSGRTPFPGNKIPVNRLDPIALKLQSFFPAPNYAGPNLNANNYFASGGPILDRNFVDAKVNYTPSAKQTLFAKYGRMWATSGGKAVFGVAGGSGLGGADPGTGDTTIQVATIGQTRTLSPTLLLDSVLGYERQDQSVLPNDYGKNYGQQFGIPNTNGPDIRQSGFPNIAITNYNGFGVPNWMPVFRVEESYTQSDNLTWTKGAHEVRFGFDLVRHHLNHWQPEIGQGPRGYLGFNGQETALKGGPANNQFNAYGAFLLGLSDDTEKSLQYILATGREWQFGWYARDRWQVSRNLTVTLGLRYELYPLMTRAGKGLERYDPSNNNVYLGGRGSVPDNAGISVSHKLFAPRVGIAYRLGEKTVVRAGYGINFDPIPFSRPLRGWYPLVVNQANIASGYGWSTTFEGGVPNTQGPDLSTGVVQLPGNASERSPDSFVHRGYVQSWNFTVERKLPLDLITSVAYVGTHSVHLLADYDINSGYPGSGTTGLPYYASYGRTVATNMWDGYLSSNYHSLQVAVNKSISKGLMVKGAYTYSKAIDYTDDDGWASVSWNWGPVFQRNRAAAGFDRTHILQVGWIYELPLGKGKMLAQTGIAAAILGNWQVNGVFSAYTGTPFTVTSPGSSLNAPSNLQTANQVQATVNQPGNVGPGQAYFDPTAFAAVTAANTFGTSGRDILRNPGVLNTDLDITREFPIKERVRLQFRAEFFNLPNTSHFYGPTNGTGNTVSVTSGTFMQITSSYGERQIRFGLRATW
jgi:hypothetical protein